MSFSGNDAINVIGSFAEGTYIAPVSGNGVDTSFTNAGLITGSAVINPVISGTVPRALDLGDDAGWLRGPRIRRLSPATETRGST